MMAYEVACHALSNDFLVSMKTRYIFCLSHKINNNSDFILRLKISSLVLLPAVNPACSATIISSVLGLGLFKMSFNMTLLGRLKSPMVL